MPAVYAHNRFGVEVRKRLQGPLKELVTEYDHQFRIGLQGPDIFFFYRPYSSNRVSDYGNHLHHVSAMPFFRHALKVVREKGTDGGAYAYLLGFICHFTLDSECHPYVSEMIRKTGVMHLEIEEEFEKYLLRLDGEDAMNFRLFDLIPTDAVTAHDIEGFFPSMDEKTVRSSLRWMKAVKHLFYAPKTLIGTCKYHIIHTGMKLSGKKKYPGVKGLMHHPVDHPACGSSNAGLLERYQASLDLAVSLMECFDQCVKLKKKLPDRFDRDFE